MREQRLKTTETSGSTLLLKLMAKVTDLNWDPRGRRAKIKAERVSSGVATRRASAGVDISQSSLAQRMAAQDAERFETRTKFSPSSRKILICFI